MFNILRGYISLLSLFVIFSLLRCLSLVTYDRKMVEKIIHRQCSMDQNNDVIIEKFH